MLLPYTQNKLSVSFKKKTAKKTTKQKTNNNKKPLCWGYFVSASVLKMLSKPERGMLYYRKPNVNVKKLIDLCSQRPGTQSLLICLLVEFCFGTSD